MFLLILMASCILNPVLAFSSEKKPGSSINLEKFIEGEGEPFENKVFSIDAFPDIQ